MATYDVFLSFRGLDMRKCFTEMLHALMKDEEQSAAILADFKPQDLEFTALSERYSSSAWYLDELSIINHCRKKKRGNTSAFNKENLSVSCKYGSVYRGGHGTGKIQSWKETLVEAMAMGATIVELRNLTLHTADEFPCSVYCCYADSFSNLQKKRGISWKVAATDAASAALNISVCGELTSFISNSDYYEVLDHLASSTRQPQPCHKISSNASKLPLSSNPRASESEGVSILNSGCINRMDRTYWWPRGLGKKNINMSIIEQAPPPPENDIILTDYRMTRETSINSLLLTICMVTTFVAALGFSSSTFKDAYSTSKDAITSRIIIAMNTLVFIVSLVMDMFLLPKSTYKWELQITLFALFGAYICLMKVMIPQAAFPLFLISVPFLFFAAA